MITITDCVLHFCILIKKNWFFFSSSINHQLILLKICKSWSWKVPANFGSQDDKFFFPRWQKVATKWKTTPRPVFPNLLKFEMHLLEHYIKLYLWPPEQWLGTTVCLQCCVLNLQSRDWGFTLVYILSGSLVP